LTAPPSFALLAAMPLQRPQLLLASLRTVFLLALAITCSLPALPAQTHTPAASADPAPAPAATTTSEEPPPPTPEELAAEAQRMEASAALYAAQEHLDQGSTIVAEKAALDALKLDPTRSAEAWLIAVEAAWQTSLLPPQVPADRQRARQHLDTALAAHPDSAHLRLLRARMKAHDGALDEAEAIAKPALEKLSQEASDFAYAAYRDSFAALILARRGDWKTAATLTTRAADWPARYDLQSALVDILEHTLKVGDTSPATLRARTIPPLPRPRPRPRSQ
jgi:tetratricopeptide (TPR) repeat protein